MYLSVDRFGIRWGRLPRFWLLKATFVVICRLVRAARAIAVAPVHRSYRFARPAHRAVISSTARNAPIARVMDSGAPTSRGSGGMNASADSLVKSGNLMPPTPHNDLHPAARDHTQEEGREESQSDLCVKHCPCPCERLVLLGGLQIRHRYGQKTFFTSISQTSFPLQHLAVRTGVPTTAPAGVAGVPSPMTKRGIS